IVTPFQIGIILTANYTFLNYLVLVLGFLLLDDGFIRRIMPERWNSWGRKTSSSNAETADAETAPRLTPAWLQSVWRSVAAIYLGWVLYATTALMFAIIPHMIHLPLA